MAPLGMVAQLSTCGKQVPPGTLSRLPAKQGVAQLASTPAVNANQRCVRFRKRFITFLLGQGLSSFPNEPPRRQGRQEKRRKELSEQAKLPRCQSIFFVFLFSLSCLGVLGALAVSFFRVFHGLSAEVGV